MDTKQMTKAANAAAGKTASAVAKTAPKPPSVLVGDMLAKYKGDIAQALPSVMTPERFSRLTINAVATNPKMIQAATESPKTLIGAVMTGAQLGLEPNTPLGQCYLLPFYNYDKVAGRKVMQVTFQLGYQGVIDLCYRSGEVTMIYAQTVYENDYFEYELGLDPKCKHIPARSDRGKPIYYYGVFKTKSGASGFQVMSYEDVMDHAKRFSKSYDENNRRFFGPWESDFNAMAKKTVLLQALKYAPKKSEFARAIASDNMVKSTIAKDMTEVPNEEINEVTGSVSPSPFAEEETDAERANKLAGELGLGRGSDLKSPSKKAVASADAEEDLGLDVI